MTCINYEWIFWTTQSDNSTATIKKAVENYNPNIKSQYLRARYYCVVTADFLTEDSYLGNITKPLTLNRYNYCVGNPLNYVDPSGNVPQFLKDLWESFWDWLTGANDPKPVEVVGIPIPPTPTPTEVPEFPIMEGESSTFGESYLETGASVSESKSNAEDCILLDEEHCKVDGYKITYIVEFLKKFESFSASPYYATAAEKANNTLTIGYGHVITSAEKDIYVAGYVMTETEATEVLEKDIISHFPSDIIDEVLKVHGPLTQNQLDALVALRFNNIAFTVIKSPNFTRILVNEDYSQEDVKQAIVNEFMTYKLQGDDILPGLVIRSTAEAILFLENDYFTDYDDLYSNPEVLKKYKDFLTKYGREDMIKYFE